MESMSLIELKQLAKEKHIKYYYMKSKSELIDLLSLADLPTFIKLQKITIRTLRQEAQQKEIEKIWSKSRKELMEALYPEFIELLYTKTSDVWKQQYTPHENQQDERNTNKHDDPQQHST